jgi:hypothetical protein
LLSKIKSRSRKFAKNFGGKANSEFVEIDLPLNFLIQRKIGKSNEFQYLQLITSKPAELTNSIKEPLLYLRK